MMFSKTCEYGLKAAIFIALHSNDNERVSLKAIAEQINSPVAFTAKILQKLVKNDIVCSVKGKNGGFEIDKDKIKKIKLAEIVKALDGDNLYNGCGLGLSKCDDTHPCPLHHKFIFIRDHLKFMLETTSLENLSQNIKDGHSYLRT